MIRIDKEAHMKEFQLLRYNPLQDSGRVTADLVECYRDVFADAPWNEWLRCEVCGKYWGAKDRANLVRIGFEHCGTGLVDFWPRNTVISDLRSDISESSCWLAVDASDKKPIGFCWGKATTLPHLEEKLKIGLPDFEKIFGRRENVAYQDEVGVISSWRGQGIAKAMVLERLKDFISDGLQVGIVRTRQYPEASGTFDWYTGKLGYQILARYPEGDGRVILGRKFHGLLDLLR